MNSFRHRLESLFLYEARDCNPNGDPLDENRPRTDPETGVATVTHVRIKRTVRDEILNRFPDVDDRLERGLEILIRDTFREDGFLSEGKDRAAQFFTEAANAAKKTGDKVAALQAEVLRRCVDARLFGTTLPLDLGKTKGSLKVTGPIQLNAFNRSLHRVSPQLVQQTAAFAAGKTARQKSFAERYLLPYALVAAYGVGNEAAARTSGATDADVSLFLDALWTGTANLATTSKMGHAPLLLLALRYAPGHKLGQLADRVGLVTDREEVAIRRTNDYAVDLGPLVEALRPLAEHLCSAEVRHDPRLRLRLGEEPADGPGLRARLEALAGA